MFPTWNTTLDLHPININVKPIIQHNLVFIIHSHLHIKTCNLSVTWKIAKTTFFFLILWTLPGVKFLGGLTSISEVTLPFDHQSKVFSSTTSDSVLSSRCPGFLFYFFYFYFIFLFFYFLFKWIFCHMHLCNVIFIYAIC